VHYFLVVVLRALVILPVLLLDNEKSRFRVLNISVRCFLLASILQVHRDIITRNVAPYVVGPQIVVLRFVNS